MIVGCPRYFHSQPNLGPFYWGPSGLSLGLSGLFQNHFKPLVCTPLVVKSPKIIFSFLLKQNKIKKLNLYDCGVPTLYRFLAQSWAILLGPKWA